MTLVAQHGTIGLNGVLAHKHVVWVIKKDLEPMSVRISLTTSKPVLAVLNFLTFHITNGLHGVNVLQLVLVALWFVPRNISVVKCSDAIQPLAVLKDIGKNGDHGLVVQSHVVLVQ